MEKPKRFRLCFDPLYLFYVLLGLLLLYLLIGSWDHRVSIAMDGVLWNQETGEILDTATLTITGKLNGKAFKNDRFQGEILLDRHESDTFDIFIEKAHGEIGNFSRSSKFAVLLNLKYSTPVDIDIWYLKDQSALRLFYQYFPENVCFIGPADSLADAEQATAALFETIRN